MAQLKNVRNIQLKLTLTALSDFLYLTAENAKKDRKRVSPVLSHISATHITPPRFLRPFYSSALFYTQSPTRGLSPPYRRRSRPF